jgi:hypothetical protein
VARATRFILSLEGEAVNRHGEQGVVYSAATVHAPQPLYVFHLLLQLLALHQHHLVAFAQFYVLD